MYKGVKFEIKPLDEVKSDIEMARKIYGSGRKHAFIADSNSVVMKELTEILRHIREIFPEIERITSYARAKSLKRLGVERLKELREAGLTRVHIGLESGDSEVLRQLRKGTTPDDMVQGALFARDAGLEVSEYVLLGAGGSDRYEEHARGTASVLNAIDPDFIRFRTLTIQPGTPLMEMKEKGVFIPVRPVERIRETLWLISGIKGISSTIVSDHVTNNLWFRGRLMFRGIDGKLPEDRESMIFQLEKTLDTIRDADENDIWDSSDMMKKGYMVGL